MSVIEVEHLSKACGSTVAVAEVTFSVEEGEIFGILARTEPGPAAYPEWPAPSSTRLSLVRSAATASASRSNSSSLIPGSRRSVKITSEPLPSVMTRTGL